MNEEVKAVHDKLFPKRQIINPVIKIKEKPKYIPAKVPDVFTQIIKVPVERVVTKVVEKPIIQERVIIKEVPVVVEKIVTVEYKPPLNTFWDDSIYDGLKED